MNQNQGLSNAIIADPAHHRRMARLRIEFKRLHPMAVPPKYQTEGAAGADFHAFCPDEKLVLLPGQTRLIRTGVSMFIGSPAWALVLMPRSGLGSKGIILANSVGLIDSDYQGEIGIFLYNRSKDDFIVSHGDRIAQGVFMPVEQANFVEVQQFSQETDRGTGGFGSTGGNMLASIKGSRA